MPRMNALKQLLPTALLLAACEQPSADQVSSYQISECEYLENPDRWQGRVVEIVGSVEQQGGTYRLQDHCADPPMELRWQAGERWPEAIAREDRPQHKWGNGEPIFLLPEIGIVTGTLRLVRRKTGNRWILEASDFRPIERRM